jgi:hypothetical protein
VAACHLAERKKRLGFNTPTAIVYTVGVISLSGGCGGPHPLLDCVISENVSLQAWVRRARAPQSLPSRTAYPCLIKSPIPEYGIMVLDVSLNLQGPDACSYFCDSMRLVE